MTKGDQIRQTSNEELAKSIYNIRNYFSESCEMCAYNDTSECKHTGYRCIRENCIEGIKAYLDMEVEE